MRNLAGAFFIAQIAAIHAPKGRKEQIMDVKKLFMDPAVASGQETLSAEMQRSLIAYAIEVTAKAERLRARRRELLKDVKVLKEKNKKGKREIVALREYAHIFERMNDDLWDRLPQFVPKVAAPPTEEAAPSPRRGFKVVVDKFGNVLDLERE